MNLYLTFGYLVSIPRTMCVFISAQKCADFVTKNPKIVNTCVLIEYVPVDKLRVHDTSIFGVDILCECQLFIVPWYLYFPHKNFLTHRLPPWLTDNFCLFQTSVNIGITMLNNTCVKYLFHTLVKGVSNVTGPPGSLLFDVKPEVALK